MAEHAIDPREMVLYEPDQFFENQVLTVKDTAMLLKLSTKTVYKLVAQGEIPHKQVGSEIRILHSELMSWMKGE